jgi:hypothetical protein
LKRQNVIYVIPLVGLLIGLQNINIFFVGFLEKVAEVNVFTDEEGETEAEAERETGGK